MPRKRKVQTENYSKAFPTAMRKLMEERDVTQNELADYLQKTRQAVSYYCDGSSSPDWETLGKIADYFNISADYLLGRTADPRRIPCAADELGLSEEAIDTLLSFNDLFGGTVVKGLDMLLRRDTFAVACKYVHNFDVALKTMVEKIDAPKDFNIAQERQLTEELVKNHPELENCIWVSWGRNYSKRLMIEAKDYFDQTLWYYSAKKDLGF